VREASIGLVAPKVRKDLNFSEDFLEASKVNIEKAFKAIETGWLHNSKFLIGDTMTIADISAYVEIGQLQSMFTNIYNFGPYPNIQKWLNEMQNVDSHDDIHAALYELGDISKEAPTMGVIINANKKAFQVIQEKLNNM
jgi:glutathione S-transferase